MTIFNVNDYESFNQASSDITRSISEFNAFLKIGNSLITKLNDESVFCGPICDSAVNGWNKINNNLTNETNSLKVSSLFLNIANSSYQSSDSENSNSIGGV